MEHFEKTWFVQSFSDAVTSGWDGLNPVYDISPLGCDDYLDRRPV
jgi:hypothetical protein